MAILKRRTILKLPATFMVVAIIIGTFAMQSLAVSAATTIACAPSVYIAAGGSCDLTLSAVIPGLWFNSDVIVTGTVPVTAGPNTFSFATTIIDERGPTAGWHLQATSASLTSSSAPATLPINLTVGLNTGVATTSISTYTPAHTNTTCPTVIFAPKTLTSTAQTFAAADNTTAGGIGYVGCVFGLTTYGSFTLPSTTPAGAYTTAITLSLMGTFA
jgi:hypothetical protein